MSREQRQRILLGVLVLAIVVIAWRQLGPRFPIGAGTESPERGGPVVDAVGHSAADLPEVVELRLEDLEKVSGQFRPGRDPFRFGEAEVPQAPPPEEQEAEAEREAAALEALRRAMEEQELRESAAPARPVLPKLDVKFLGSFGPRRQRLAVFSDGVEIFNVLEGGVLKDHFVIKQIGFESVDVGYLGYPDEPAIRLAAGG